MDKNKIISFRINPPFWGKSQIFNDSLLDSPFGIKKSIDDIRDGGEFYIELQYIKDIDLKLYKLLHIPNFEKRFKKINIYIKNRKYWYYGII